MKIIINVILIVILYHFTVTLISSFVYMQMLVFNVQDWEISSRIVYLFGCITVVGGMFAKREGHNKKSPM